VPSRVTAIVDDRLEGLKTGRGQLKDFNSLVNLPQWLGTPVSREKHGKCSAHASHPLHPHLQMEVLDVMEYF
jgi:hypothetical protein